MTAPAAGDTATTELVDSQGDGKPPGDRHYGDLLAIAILAVIPLVVYGGTYLFGGHVLLVGDNLIQNYPLRALVGSDFHHGIFPSWNPWIFGGTPLLAGLNAGALYPTTWLFALLNAGLAWVLNEIILSIAIAVGTYLFFRISGVGRLGAFLGALTFAFAGAVAGQGAVHIDMTEGFVSLPWLLIAIRKLMDEGRWRWSALLALAACCLVLSGSPESILDISCLCAAYLVVRLTFDHSNLVRLAIRGVVGSIAGIGASAVVWVPALAFIGTSQRSQETASFASSFSYPPKEFFLGVIPFLEGGSKLFSQPVYFGQSNLPEITMYVGILPLVALGALASRRWRERLPTGEARTWLAIAAVGIVLAIGSGTPLGHLIVHIPFYGKQRDQGRNIVTFDLAASAALAWWVDGGKGLERVRTRSETITAAALILGTGAVGVAFAISPSWVWVQLGAAPQAASSVSSIDLAITVAGVLAVGGFAVAHLGRRMSNRAWRRLACGFVVVDLAVFAGGSYLWSSQPIATTSRPGPVFTLVSRALPPGSDQPGGGGRYGVYNPDLFYPDVLVASAEPDVGIMTHDPSAEGYSAIQNAEYAFGTGTHLRNSLNVKDLAAGRFAQLDLDVMVAPAEYFLIPLAGEPKSPKSFVVSQQGPGRDPLLPGGNVPLRQDALPPLRPLGPNPALSTGHRAGWYFGTSLTPAEVTMVLASPASGQKVKIGVVGNNGAVSWGSPQRLIGTRTTFALPPTSAIGLMLRLVKGPTLPRYQVTASEHGQVLLLDGPLARAVSPLRYTDAGEADDFTVFRSRSTPPAVWAQAVGTKRDLAGASHLSAKIVTLAAGYDTEAIEIDAPQAVLLTRSTAYDEGWVASVVSGPHAAVEKAAAGLTGGRGPAGGHGATVQHVGLVQGVEVPAGWSLVYFHYQAKGLSKGEHITEATLALVVLACLVGAAIKVRIRRLTRRPGGEVAARNADRTSVKMEP